jgi:hypothetical protein
MLSGSFLKEAYVVQCRLRVLSVPRSRVQEFDVDLRRFNDVVLQPQLARSFWKTTTQFVDHELKPQ